MEATDPTSSALLRQWRPDVLGPGFEQLELPLGSDDEGEVVATLVRHRPERVRRFTWPWERRPELAASGADVLYVHGWSDYFFNPELAAFWTAAGARFFALDLRKYGRSLRPGQTPGYITDLAAYDADIEAALAAMGHGNGGSGGHGNGDGGTVGNDGEANGNGNGNANGAQNAAAEASTRPLILLGHSTGGLTLSLWAARHPGRASALVLNSPWLEFQLSRPGREVLAPVLSWGARLNPLGPMPNVDLGFYARSVAKEQDGEWEYSHDWRPDRGFATHPAWLTAILAGHATVAEGIEVGVPVLTLLSARSTLLPRWDDAMLTTDIVLVVDAIAEQSLKLGREVSVARVDGALHDVFLSRRPVRAAAYSAISRWLRGYAPAPSPTPN